jgi:hypothetical protein
MVSASYVLPTRSRRCVFLACAVPRASPPCLCRRQRERASERIAGGGWGERGKQSMCSTCWEERDSERERERARAREVRVICARQQAAVYAA